MIETALNKYSTLVKNLLPILQKQSRGSYIGLAILCLLAQQAYSYLTPPKFLREFPRVSFFATVKSLYTNESVNDRFKRLVLPVIKDGDGFYVVSDANWRNRALDGANSNFPFLLSNA